MRQKLIILLHNDTLDTPSWILFAEGKLHASVYKGDAMRLAKLAELAEVLVFIPSEDTLLTTLQLPKMNRARLQQALPFALEDQLIPDINDLHIVAGAYDQGRVPVVAVAKEKMKVWLALLAEWRVKPDKMLPDIFAIKLEPGEAHLAITSKAILRLSLYEGFSCDLLCLKDLWQLFLSKQTDVPLKLKISNYTSEKIDLGFTGAIEIESTRAEDHEFISDVAVGIHSLPDLNLLQGDYALKKSRFLKRNRLLQASISMVVIWIILLLSAPLISSLILQKKSQQIAQEIAGIYKKHFPQAKTIVAPKLRMEEKLRTLSQHTQEGRFFILLAIFGEEFKNSGNIAVKRIDYQKNQMTIELSAENYETFSAFTGKLQGRGLKMQQQNANVNGSNLTATLLIE